MRAYEHNMMISGLKGQKSDAGSHVRGFLILGPAKTPKRAEGVLGLREQREAGRFSHKKGWD